MKTTSARRHDERVPANIWVALRHGSRIHQPARAQRQENRKITAETQPRSDAKDLSVKTNSAENATRLNAVGKE